MWLFSNDRSTGPKNKLVQTYKKHTYTKASVSFKTLNKRSRLTCSLERAPLCVCSSSVFPLIHSVSRVSCPHGKLYTILTPRDAASSSSSSGTSLLPKSDGDSANWKDMGPFDFMQLKLSCVQILRCTRWRQHPQISSYHIDDFWNSTLYRQHNIFVEVWQTLTFLHHLSLCRVQWSSHWEEVRGEQNHTRDVWVTSAGLAEKEQLHYNYSSTTHVCFFNCELYLYGTIVTKNTFFFFFF